MRFDSDFRIVLFANKLYNLYYFGTAFYCLDNQKGYKNGRFAF